MNKRRIGVRAIIWHEGKLLAVQHAAKDSKSKGYWVIPGGGLDPGESLEAGLERELMEELGVKAKVGRLLMIQQFHSGRADCDEELEFFFLVVNREVFITIDTTGTSHGVDEIAACEFINPAGKPILPRILGEIELEAYVKDIQPVLIANEL